MALVFTPDYCNIKLHQRLGTELVRLRFSQSWSVNDLLFHDGYDNELQENERTLNMDGFHNRTFVERLYMSSLTYPRQLVVSLVVPQNVLSESIMSLVVTCL